MLEGEAVLTPVASPAGSEGPKLRTDMEFKLVTAVLMLYGLYGNPWSPCV